MSHRSQRRSPWLSADWDLRLAAVGPEDRVLDASRRPRHRLGPGYSVSAGASGAAAREPGL